MKKYCNNYVNLKYEIDDKLQQQVEANVISSHAHFASVNPIQFMLKTLPFSSTKEKSDSFFTQVDPFSVVGGTFNDYSSINVSEECCELINKQSKKYPQTTNAHYLKLGDMPLYIALERKNRVKLFRHFNIPINCNVKIVKYPKPNELKIHKVRWRNGLYFVSCSNNDFFREQYQGLKYHGHKNESLKLYGNKTDGFTSRSRKFQRIDLYGHISDSLVQVVFPQYILPMLLKYGVEYGDPIMKPFTKPFEEKALNYFAEHDLRLS